MIVSVELTYCRVSTNEFSGWLRQLEAGGFRLVAGYHV